MGAVDIGYGQLLLSLTFIVFAGGSSLVYGLGLGRDLLVGATRTFAQLILMGYALVLIFRIEHGLPIVLIFSLMVAFAAVTIRGRVKERRVAFVWPVFLSMLSSYLVVTVVVTGVVVGVKPWWKPQYFIPLGGMVVGNSMTALAISLERLFADLRTRRGEVEMMLCLGADGKEASHTIFRDALKSGMIPSINSMMGVGVVFIPGMMTGQIIAGADPLTAIKYQIVVMLMLVGSTCLGSLLVLSLVRRRCFDKGLGVVVK